MEIGIRSHDRALSKREFSDSVRQVLLLRHHCASDQDRNNWNVSRQCAFDFHTDEVARIRQPRLASAIDRLQPRRANDHEHDIRFRDRTVEVPPEVHAKRNRVDIHVDSIVPEVLDQAIVDAAGYIGGVITPIGDEDLHRSSRDNNVRLPRRGRRRHQPKAIS
jgi:hypothetical protein